MKAVVKTRPEPGFVEVIDVPIPQIKSDEVLVKIHSTGLCGTDILLHDWRYTGRRPVNTPIILGHEGAGEVVEVGSVPAHYETANRWLENGFVRVEPVVTHTFGFEEAVKGIELVKKKQAGKVMFRA